MKKDTKYLTKLLTESQISNIACEDILIGNMHKSSVQLAKTIALMYLLTFLEEQELIEIIRYLATKHQAYMTRRSCAIY